MENKNQSLYQDLKWQNVYMIWENLPTNFYLGKENGLRLPTLQMFAGIYRDFAGKSECRDFKFTGIACIPAIPLILIFPRSDFHYNICRDFIVQGYYGDSLH